MTKNKGPKLVIAISSTALFDMRESHKVYEEQGVAAYAEYQRQHEDVILEPGEAFPLASKLLRINEKLGGRATGRDNPAIAKFCGHRLARL